MTQTTIGRRGSRRLEQEFQLQRRPTSREVQKRNQEESGGDLVVVREAEEEEDVRSRIQNFAIRPMSARSDAHVPKSPARPRDILASV